MQGINIVGVQFRRAGKIYDFSAGSLELSIGDNVVVDSERGPSTAQVVEVRFHNPLLKLDKKLKSVIRKVSFREIYKPSRLEPEQVESFAKERVASYKLKMRILKCEIQFDGNKIIIYFSAPERVDFRELVKDLASGLKTRVELRQVGARDETKILGGIGICGREYCCSSFLREFAPISIRMAKNQNLALNPSKVSGGCGRLLCCLTYENDTYAKLRQVLPPLEAKVVLKSDGTEGVVIKNDLLNQVVVIRTIDKQEIKVKVEDVIFKKSTYSNLEFEQGFDDNSEDFSKEDSKDSDADLWAQSLDFDALTEKLEERDKSSENRGSRGKNTYHSRNRNFDEQDGRRGGKGQNNNNRERENRSPNRGGGNKNRKPLR